MDTLKEKLRTAIADYAGKGFNVESYVTVDEANHIYALVSIGDFKGKSFVDTSIIARLEGDKVIIEKDTTNKPLAEALLQAGIPEEQIELRYLDEQRRVQGQA
jgi:uncharacterized protein (UPF0218 family)